MSIIAKALAVVRSAPRSDGKRLRDRVLANDVALMLGALRSKDRKNAERFASSIVKNSRKKK